MKTIKFFGLAAAAMLAFSASALSLAEARARISEAIEDSAVMAAIMAELSAEDQITFLGDVNAAIESMPGSSEEKSAKFLTVNRAAVKNAKPGNMANMIAEVYATVPPESLTVVNEQFAATMFNRAADSSTTYTDEQFTAIAKAVSDKIQARNAGSDDAAVRNTFGALMFVRASKGSPANLSETLTEGFDPDTQAKARNEWMPAALETPANYGPLLGASENGAEDMPNIPVVIRIAGPQVIDAMLADLASAGANKEGGIPTAYTEAATSTIPNGAPFLNEGLERIPVDQVVDYQE